MLEHGGNLSAASQQYGIALADWLDLSTGINPDGYPVPAIPAAAWQALPTEHDTLAATAANYYGCQFALPTAGSQAALQVLPQLRARSNVAMPGVMYQEHGHAWQRCGHTVTRFDSYPDAHTLQHADVILLCNPNNPTATQYTCSDLLAWHQQLAARGGWLVVDEAFMDASAEHSLAAHTHLEGLLVLRSLGKFFGLAGARVGFLLGAPQLLNRAQLAIGPWSISGPSRWVAIAALQDQHWQTRTRSQLAINSQRLAALLTENGLPPLAGTALFQYVVTEQAALLHQHLASQGVWVRLFQQPSALRFGLPPEPAWSRLELALQSWRP